jgi:CubicO group peptidase (beta-lactamase class C family)
MTYRRRFVALALALVSLGSGLRAQSHRNVPPALDAYFSKALADWGLPGMAIAVVRNDSLLFAKGYGVRELRKNAPVDEHTVFDAASLTKSFTATAIGMLVDEKRMRWDDPVRSHVPELELPDPYLTRNVTVRDLLSHRTGLQAANFMWRFTGIDRAEAIRRMRFLRPEIPFRTGMVYSNIGYTLAGEASARAAKVSWDSFIRSRILEPLGMRETFLWSERDAHASGNVASAHAEIEEVHVAIDARDGTQQRDGRISTAPAGSVQSSVWDLARWMRFHLARGTLDGKRFVSEAVMDEMHAAQVIVPTNRAFRAARQLEFGAAYGLGWQVWDYRGRPMLWHSGSGNGQIAYLALLPKDGLGVVVLINSWRAPILHGSLASRIIDHYLGFETRDYSADALRGDSAARARAHDAWMRFESTAAATPAFVRPAGSYAGVYDDTLHGKLTITERGNKLLLQMEQGATARLEPWNADTLFVRWDFPIFREAFTTTARFDVRQDRVASFHMVLNRDTIRAVRKP